MKTYRIFDAHTHVYPDAIAPKARDSLGRFYDFYVYGQGTRADLEADMAQAHIQGCILLAVATNAHQVCKVNDGIAAAKDLFRAAGFDVYAFGGIHQDFTDMEAEVERMKTLGLSGVKIHPDIQGVDIDDPRLMPLYRCVEGHMPVYFHMGDGRPQYRFSEANKLMKVLEKFPRLEVVAAHLGGYCAWKEARELAKMPNVWYDTSSALEYMSPEEATEQIFCLGADRVMFGSDYPRHLPSEELTRLFALKLTEEERENIFWRNAARFLHSEA